MGQEQKLKKMRFQIEDTTWWAYDTSYKPQFSHYKKCIIILFHRDVMKNEYEMVV